MKPIIVSLTPLLPVLLLIARTGDAHELVRGPTNKTVPSAKATFDEVNRLIAEKYVDPSPSDDEMWTGAIHGVLDRLIQTKGIKVNALLEPDQLKELEGGLHGTVVGVGVIIKKFEGVLFLKGVVPNSAAAKAGLEAGDRVLAVDGKPVRELPLDQIVAMIRGPEGTTVDLTVQRDQKEWVQPLTRSSLKIDSVTGRMLGDKIGYVRIHVFNKNTPAQLDQVLQENVRGAEGIVLDLRDCPGGLFDEALLAADRFLAPNTAIVKMKGRDGKEDVRRASRKDPSDQLPIVALIDEDTASSAEILAAALADNDRAKLVGETTLGKGTVETVLKLSNGWGLKLTVARFVSPKGRSWQGTGLQPDVPIAKRKLTAAEELEIKEPAIDQDPQVKTAATLLALRKH
jgi:carboxyl-terminal processing protease